MGMSLNNSDEHTDTPGDNVDGPPSNNTRSKKRKRKNIKTVIKKKTKITKIKNVNSSSESSESSELSYIEEEENPPKDTIIIKNLDNEDIYDEDYDPTLDEYDY